MSYWTSGRATVYTMRLTIEVEVFEAWVPTGHELSDMTEVRMD